MIQQQVYETVPVGVPGDKATLNPTAYTVHNYLADASGVVAGSFVWEDTDGLVTNTQPDPAVAPLGIVERLLVYPGPGGVSGGATLTIDAGQAVSVVVKGDMYVEAGGSVTVGQSAYAMADGSITFAASGATVSGGVETDWIAKSAGTAGDTVIVSNY